MNRKIVIGVDGACWELLDEFIERGELPNFKAIKEEGSSGVLKSTLPPITVPAWASMFTGKDPGELGLYSFQYFDPDKGKMELVSSSDIKADFIWEELSPQKKSVVINVPGTYPIRDFNGVLISGSLTPSSLSDFVYPKSLKKKVNELTDGYIIEPSTYQKSKSEIYREAMETYNKREKLTRFLFKKEEFDLFVVVFRATDIIQHHFWNDKEKLFKVYKKIDDFLGFLLEETKEDEIFIVSDHGFSGVKKDFKMNKWLEKQEYLDLKEKKDGKKKFFGSLLKKLYAVVKKLGLSRLTIKYLPGKYRKKVKRMMESSKEGLNITNALEGGYIDFKKDSFTLINNQKVNVIKTRSEDKKELIEKIENIEYKGEKLFEVKESGEVYKKAKENFPKLVVKSKSNYTISSHLKIKEMFSEPLEEATHDMDGIFISNKKIKEKPESITQVIKLLK